MNLAAYYLCGIPTAIILAFRFKMGGTGLWIGITAGSFVQSVLLGLNYHYPHQLATTENKSERECDVMSKYWQARKARERLMGDEFEEHYNEEHSEMIS
ncbi:hypothetical protein DY000_02022773 [Brassica cretica]|uniref:Protein DETOXIFICATION n=1 Tax=Brassica cretica TaxID=69181 RepID=A0ABQ7EDI8_BRACR|nr:hypothetical protein DY000_02022773 [Brassica cretica]